MVRVVRPANKRWTTMPYGAEWIGKMPEFLCDEVAHRFVVQHVDEDTSLIVDDERQVTHLIMRGGVHQHPPPLEVGWLGVRK